MDDIPMIRIKINEKVTEDIQRDNQKAQSIVIPLISPNHSIAIITEIILNRVTDIVYKDETISEHQRSTFIKTAQRSKEPIQKYLLGMDRDDAESMIEDIRSCISK